MKFRVLPHITVHQVAAEWDELAPIRYEQILSGVDITFNHVMMPSFFEFMSGEQPGKALDAGCGIGVLTKYLSNYFKSVVGIDPSGRSLEFARGVVGQGVTLLASSIEDFSEKYKQSRFDVITANMVLMDAPNINSFAKAVNRLLKPGGCFIFSITHPAFWPFYYGYSEEPWYSYSRSTIIESPFRISAEPNCQIMSTHIHRPLERYFAALREADLFLEIVREPFPADDVQALYPQPWKFPHYFIGKCRKLRTRTAI